MNAEKPSARAIRYAKRQKRNDEGSSSAVIDTPNPAEVAAVEQIGDIFKLDFDCYEEAFDYLPIFDLVNVGKTCKRLQQVAGYCFQQNYSGRAYFSYGIIHCVDVRHFVPFTQRIGVDDLSLRHLFAFRSKFQRLKQIRFNCLKIADINRLKEFPMGKIEVLGMSNCDLGKKFHEIIVHCTKLKRLEIDDCNGKFDWINRKYPTLEYFKFEPSEDKSIKGIPKFLELNPNIRKFATTAGFLLENRDNFMLSNVKLDDLAIYNCANFDVDKPVFNLLNALHERGFYKKLQLYILCIENQKQINQLVTIKGLVKLYVKETRDPFSFSSLRNLEELYVRSSNAVADLEILPNNLVNLKRIYFDWASIDLIMLFIRRSTEMQRIHVEWLEEGVHFNSQTKVIDLLALNREREQLPDAQKITLYVKEEIYLTTKWAMNGNDFGLIRVKRKESFVWDHDFRVYRIPT